MIHTTKAEDKYSLLTDTFCSHLPWQGARVKFLVLVVTSILKVRTVCFERLAEGMDSESEVTSRLRRIQRFFAAFVVDSDLIAQLLFALLPNKTNLTISIDRTNWKFGVTDINIFMLSVCYEGMALPVMWEMLEKRGNSNTEERTALIGRFVGLFGKQCIAALVADREFIGDQWFGYLEKESIPFHIRIRENLWFRKPNGEMMKMSWIAQSLPVNKVYHHPAIIFLGDSLVYVSIIRLKGEYLIIASYQQQQQAVQYYKDRWQIETMFKAFKTNGFNIEDTHLKVLERLDKLVALVSIAFVWAYKAGIHEHINVKPIQIKKHGRKAYSYFKYGWRVIADILLSSAKNQIEKLYCIIKVLSCT